MKTYNDKRISFSYPDDFMLVRAKIKWGQYNLKKNLGKKKTIVIIIHFVPEDAVDAHEQYIHGCQFDELTKGEYYGKIVFGVMCGIGHVVTLFDPLNNFVQKRYCYLFSIHSGGLYVEIIGDENFEIEIFKEFVESIIVKKQIEQEKGTL